MPLIDLTIPEGSIDEEALGRLTDQLAGALLRAEGAPDTDLFRSITWVYVHEVPPARLAVGGRPGGEPRFRVGITVPDGALDDERKQQLVTAAHAAVVDAAGLDADKALHVWTIIDEVTDGNWGAGGNVIRIEDLRRIASTERKTPAAATS